MKSLFAPVRVFAFIHLHSENIWEFGEEEKGGKKNTCWRFYQKTGDDWC